MFASLGTKTRDDLWSSNYWSRVNFGTRQPGSPFLKSPRFSRRQWPPANNGCRIANWKHFPERHQTQLCSPPASNLDCLGLDSRGFYDAFGTIESVNRGLQRRYLSTTIAATMLASSTMARQLVRSQHKTMPAFQAVGFLLQQQRGYATPMGAPKNFRIKQRPEWDQEKEGTFERAGKYFLMTEMARGMYVLLEQFFRPP